MHLTQVSILRCLLTNLVYTANFQGTGIACKHGNKYPVHASVCMETQKYPDAPNKKNFPSANLKPGEKYHSHVVYKFSVK